MAQNRAERRASPVKYPTSLDEWSHDRLLTVELPPTTDGKPVRKVDIEIPDFFALSNKGLIPNPLRSIAEKAETMFDPSEASDEEKTQYFEFVCWTVGRALKKPNLVEELGSPDAAQAWVAEHIPPMHRLILWQKCMHLFSEEDAAAFRALAAAMLQVSEAEIPPVRGLEDVATFPEGSVGAEPSVGSGEDGASA